MNEEKTIWTKEDEDIYPCHCEECKLYRIGCHQCDTCQGIKEPLKVLEVKAFLGGRFV